MFEGLQPPLEATITCEVPLRVLNQSNLLLENSLTCSLIAIFETSSRSFWSSSLMSCNVLSTNSDVFGPKRRLTFESRSLFFHMSSSEGFPSLNRAKSVSDSSEASRLWTNSLKITCSTSRLRKNRFAPPLFKARWILNTLPMTG
jgi:hypothetical protein